MRNFINFHSKFNLNIIWEINTMAKIELNYCYVIVFLKNSQLALYKFSVTIIHVLKHVNDFQISFSILQIS